MPRDVAPKKKAIPRVTGEPSVHTLEATAFVNGLFREFRDTVIKYGALNHARLTLEGQIDVTEKTVCLMRDHLAMKIKESGVELAPGDWQPVFEEVRFVGVRLVDACLSLLQTQGRMTPEALLLGLNGGMFRFRTSSPLREIHAAMLRQRRAKKIGNEYVLIDGGGERIEMRPRLTAVAAPAELVEDDKAKTA